MKLYDVLKILYFLIFLFIGKQIFDIFKAKRSISSSKLNSFYPKAKVSMGFVSGALIVLGVYSIAIRDYFGVVYLLAGLGFTFLTSEKIVVYEEGIYHNARFDKWDEIKRWSYDDKTNTLKLTTTKVGSKSERLLPIKYENKEAVLEIIKSKKKKRK